MITPRLTAFKISLNIFAVALAAMVCGIAHAEGSTFTKDANGCAISRRDGTMDQVPKADQIVTWDGKCKNGFAEGKGIAQWFEGSTPGDRDECEFKHGEPNGQCKTTSPDGSFIEGHFTDGKMNGHVVVSLPRSSEHIGGRIEGEFDDHMDGRGTHVTDEFSYEGEFKHGALEGHGKMKFSDGGRYEGEFKQNKRDGFGTMTYANGATYSGYWKSGHREGHGLVVLPDGGRYEGDFASDLLDGHGTVLGSKGDRFEGSFKEGKPNGFGTYDRPPGTHYEGQFYDGKFEGYGKLTSEGGVYYEGTFHNGLREGHGRLVTSAGTYDGNFAANAINGHGQWVYKDGTRVEGESKNGSFTPDNGGAAPDVDLAAIQTPVPGPSGLEIFASILTGAAQGYQQGVAIRNQNRSSAPANQRVPPPLSIPVYTTQTSANNAAVYDNALDQCVKLGGDGQSVYFDNGCNASLTIIESQRGQGVPETVNCNPGSRCTFGIFGVGYTNRENYTYAVCPNGDYIESAPGVQWSGSGPFRCRRPW